MVTAEDLEGGITAENLLFFQLEVRRENLLEDSIVKLAHTKKNLKKPLRISFVNEPGVDEGGVKAEYFQLITKEILNPYLGMFLPKSNNRLYWFNGNSF